MDPGWLKSRCRSCFRAGNDFHTYPKHIRNENLSGCSAKSRDIDSFSLCETLNMRSQLDIHGMVLEHGIRGFPLVFSAKSVLMLTLKPTEIKF